MGGTTTLADSDEAVAVAVVVGGVNSIVEAAIVAVAGPGWTCPNSPSSNRRILMYPSVLQTKSVRPSLDHAASTKLQ